MNQEQFKASWDQLKGALKKKWGNFTDDDLLQIEGDQDKFNGTIQKRYGDKKEEVSKWANRWYARWSGWYEGYEESKSTS
ncbi:MAG: CsbD family protein [Nitrospiraceae bacterium]